MRNINPNTERGELNFWKWVESWVNWFQKHYKYIECIYTTSNTFDENCKNYILQNIGEDVDDYSGNLIKYIEKTFNNNK